MLDDVLGQVPAAELEAAFADTDGDGIRRFFIYDYGVGDEATVTFAFSLQRGEDGAWRGDVPVPVTLTLPGEAPIVLRPGD